MVLFLRMIFSPQDLKKALLVAGLILCGTCGLVWAEGADKNAEEICKDGIIFSQKIDSYDDVVHGDSTIYLVEIENIDCEYHIDRLSFYSIHLGKKVLLRRESLDYEFMSVTILGGSTLNVYVMQITPTGAYTVDGYFLGSDKIEKIVSVGSYFPPNFLTLENYHEALLIDRNKRYEERIPDTYDVYEIAGKEVIHHKDVKFSFPKNFKK